MLSVLPGWVEALDVLAVPLLRFPVLATLPPWACVEAAVAVRAVAVRVGTGFGLTLMLGRTDVEAGLGSAGLAGLSVTPAPAPPAETSPGCGQT